MKREIKSTKRPGLAGLGWVQVLFEMHVRHTACHVLMSRPLEPVSQTPLIVMRMLRHERIIVTVVAVEEKKVSGESLYDGMRRRGHLFRSSLKHEWL